MKLSTNMSDKNGITIIDQGFNMLGDPTPSLNLQAGIDFTLLETPFMAAFKKVDGVIEILVTPTNSEEVHKVSIGEMVKQVCGLMGSGGDTPEEKKKQKELEDNIVGKIDEVGPKPNTPNTDDLTAIDYKKIKVYLNQAFFYMKKEGEQSAQIEYALSVGIDMSELLPPDFKLFTIENIYISIWNTTRKKILNKMSMLDFTEYIN